MISSRDRRRRFGFTLAETLVLIVLGTVVAGALYQVLVFQQRFYRHERAATERHDALRLAASVLLADIIEANGGAGDFTALWPDSITVRSPVGFAIVCDVDAPSSKLGLFGVAGRLSTTDGDTLLIYHPDGWLLRTTAQLSSSESQSCPYAAGPTIEASIRVTGSVDGVPVGAPVRAFHPYTYRLEGDAGSWWLARRDGDEVEILAGPFSGDGSGLEFEYLDAAGDKTDDPARVARVNLTLVAGDGRAAARLDTLSVTVRPRNQ